VRHIGKDVEELKKSISMKADISDMIEVFDSKTSKVSLKDMMTD
jgi:hypothetical protein